MDLTKEKGLEDFDIFIKSIEMIYGKNYFIDYTKSQNHLAIHLYFDEITIKNSQKRSHVIKDLFIRIDFHINDGKYELQHGLNGYRTFITQSEANAQYCHSHLSQGGSFCLGSGPLSKFMEKHGYSMTLNKEYIDLFDEMLLMIFHYARWESLEGTPYKKMERIVKSNPTSQYEKISNEFISNTNIAGSLGHFNNDFIAKLFNCSKPIQLKENKYILKFDNELLLNLEPLATVEKRVLYLYKGSDGNLYLEQAQSSNKKEDPIKVMKWCSLPKFPIKLESGKIIESLSTEETVVGKDIEFKKTINKQFLTNIITHIEEKIKQKA